MITQQSRLSNLQKELLKLYANNISDEDLLEIRLLLSQYFAKKATDEMDKFLDEHEIDEDTLTKWSHEHNRYEGSN
ncbi:MAG TPA: hypothetical protein VIM16_02875 [Mucilaginibacter sp.]